MKKNEKGFSAIEILIVIVVLVLIGGAIWFVTIRKKDNSSAQTNQTKTTASQKASNTAETKDQATSIPTNEIVNSKFSVSIPESWNSRTCSDIEGLGAIVPPSGGPMACKTSDATWLETDIAARAKVAIGEGTNPYPRQDWSSGSQKDMYESDAKNVTLSNGKTAKKYTYKAEESKGKYFAVTEYTVDDKASVYVFDGHSSEEHYYGNDTPTAELIKIVESTVLPSLVIK